MGTNKKQRNWDWGDVFLGLLITVSIGAFVALITFAGIVAVHYVVKYW